MKTMSKLLIACVMTSSFSLAEDSFFAGLGIGNAEMTLDYSGGATGSSTTDGGSQTLLFGKIISDKHVAAISYTNINSDSDVSASTMQVSYEHLFTTDKKEFKPFIGATLGQLSYTETGLSGSYTADTFDLSATFITFDFGLWYDISKDHSVNFMYNYGINGSGSQAMTHKTAGVIDFELDKVNKWAINYLYKFK